MIWKTCNLQAEKWLHDWANARHVETTGKVPWLMFENVEQPRLNKVPPIPFDTDDVDHDTVNASCRVRFDRNTYSVPWYFVSQRVLLRADTDTLRIFLGDKCIAEHQRNWGIRQDLELDAHRTQLEQSRRRKPSEIAGARFGATGSRYFKLLSASTRSLKKEGVRLICLAELYGTKETERAMAQVMEGGHLGADYVEHVLRKSHPRRRRASIKVGNEELDALELSEPDLTQYDQGGEDA